MSKYFLAICFIFQCVPVMASILTVELTGTIDRVDVSSTDLEFQDAKVGSQFVARYAIDSDSHGILGDDSDWYHTFDLPSYGEVDELRWSGTRTNLIINTDDMRQDHSIRLASPETLTLADDGAIGDTTWDEFRRTFGALDLWANHSTSFLLREPGVTLSGKNDSVRIGTAIFAGDVDQDLDFDFADIVRVLHAGKFETGQPATWGDGDWNGSPGFVGDPPAGDGVFDFDDLLVSLRLGNFENGSYAAIVPEPSTAAIMILLGACFLLARRTR